MPQPMQPIEYQKVMTEVVYINLPGPSQPVEGMTGGELLHGFLADLYAAPNPDVKSYIMTLCNKWNVHYVEPGSTSPHSIGKKK